MTTMQLMLRLPTDPRAAGAARRGIGALSGFVEEGELDCIELLVSEVVTNSLRHSGAPPEMAIRLDVEVERDCVKVWVRDAGHGFTKGFDQSDPASRVGHWGLYLVDTLADRWGVDVSDATTVWFEVSSQA